VVMVVCSGDVVSVGAVRGVSMPHAGNNISRPMAMGLKTE